MEKAKKPVAKPSGTQGEISAEATSFLGALYQEMSEQADKYLYLTRELLTAQARVELAEKTLCLTRDHLANAIERSDSAVPHDWNATLNKYRFVGVRLADACMALLKEQKKMTPQEMLIELNEAMYRFRTSSPLREIHAALLRQNFAKKDEDQNWVWIGAEEESPMRPNLPIRAIAGTVVTGDEDD